MMFVITITIIVIIVVVVAAGHGECRNACPNISRKLQTRAEMRELWWMRCAGGGLARPMHASTVERREPDRNT
eukprot:6187093-Pyramimonas_sp.AAC.1